MQTRQFQSNGGETQGAKPRIGMGGAVLPTEVHSVPLLASGPGLQTFPLLSFYISPSYPHKSLNDTKKGIIGKERMVASGNDYPPGELSVIRLPLVAGGYGLILFWRALFFSLRGLWQMTECSGKNIYGKLHHS